MKMKFEVIQLLILAALVAAAMLIGGCQSLNGTYQWSNGNSEGTIELKKIDSLEAESEEIIKEQFEMPEERPDALLPSTQGLAVKED